MKAIWNDQIIVESDDTVVVEGNHYFPKEAIDSAFLKQSTTETTCPWKGTASYFTIHVAGKENEDSAWYYENPKPAASKINGRVAFWKGIRIEE